MIHLPDFRGAVFATLLSVLFCASMAGGVVPSGPPTFSNPLEIDNRYLPMQPGSLHVYAVKEDELTIGIIVDICVNETRTFQWNGTEVPCRIYESLDFLDGELTGLSRKFLAQADDGAVYFFGEVADNYFAGGVVLHHGSWLVGGATLPSDPEFSEWKADPTIYMLGQPEVGDRFKPEDIPPVLDETNEIAAIGVDISVPGGNFRDAIEIVETSELEPDFHESKWYAPDVGVVKAFDGVETTVLLAATRTGGRQSGIDFSFWGRIH